jgi:hypothetical protein
LRAGFAGASAASVGALAAGSPAALLPVLKAQIAGSGWTSRVSVKNQPRRLCSMVKSPSGMLALLAARRQFDLLL